MSAFIHSIGILSNAFITSFNGYKANSLNGLNAIPFILLLNGRRDVQFVFPYSWRNFVGTKILVYQNIFSGKLPKNCFMTRDKSQPLFVKKVKKYGSINRS